ncbi:MAG TPA: D-alanyl-D-alanine carboxypeptidase, partial [Candidatus Gallacutalibacter pullistercoris]|nr:D-alanyl-D-alanine carboxypeptidase [Candidatus Gallacutalibacter pullistercoris]
SSSIVVTTDLPKSIEAPVEKGQKIGTATLSYAGQKLTTIDLVASESVERSNLLHTLSQVQQVVTSRWFILIVSVILTLLVIYIIIAVIYNRKRRNLKKVKKYRKM